LTQKLSRASEEGSLSVRAEVVNQDEIGRMAMNFNLYVTSVQQLMIGVSDMVSALSKGNLDHRYKADAKGDLNILKEDVNMSADKIQDVISELERAIHCIKEATYDFESQTQFEGDFSVMVSDLQDAMKVTHEAVTGINATMEHIAAGEFSSRLNANLMGELDALKTNINHSLDQLEDGIIKSLILNMLSLDLSKIRKT